MPRLTTRDYKRPSRGSRASKLKEFGFGVIVGAMLASAAFLIGGARARHSAAAAHAHGAAGQRAAAPHSPVSAASSSDGSDTAMPASSAGAASSSRAASAGTGAQAPQYDFYRMLPRLNVPVPHEDDQPARTPLPAPSPAPRRIGVGPLYLLQVGSYRSNAEADQVRARLARAGIAAQVERVAEGSGTWNRVRIGPLSDTELARVRAQLRSANIHALLIRADR